MRELGSDDTTGYGEPDGGAGDERRGDAEPGREQGDAAGQEVQIALAGLEAIDAAATSAQDAADLLHGVRETLRLEHERLRALVTELRRTSERARHAAAVARTRVEGARTAAYDAAADAAAIHDALVDAQQATISQRAENQAMRGRMEQMRERMDPTRPMQREPADATPESEM